MSKDRLTAGEAHLHSACKHRVWPWVMGVLVVVIGLVCVKRWHVWFGDLPEAAYVLGPEPQRVWLTPGNEGESSRRVSWVSGHSCPQSQLCYVQQGTQDTVRIPAAERALQTRGGLTVAHHAALKGLKAGATYLYRAENGPLYSKWYHFSMPQAGDVCNFLYFGDVQDTIGGKTNLLIGRAAKRFPTAEFYAFGGDFIERPMNGYWEENYHALDSVATTKPIVACTGNHEYLKHLIRQVDVRFPYAFSYFVQSSVGKNLVYSTTFPHLTLVLLDSNREPWFLWRQRMWLKKVLSNVQTEWVVVMLHHPVISIKNKTNGKIGRWMFKELIEEKGVDLVLQGHEHNYGRKLTRTPEGHGVTPIYVVSNSSPKSYRLNVSTGYDRYGTGSGFYIYVHATADSLQMQTYDKDDHLYDRVTVVREHGVKRVVDEAASWPEMPEVVQARAAQQQ